ENAKTAAQAAYDAALASYNNALSNRSLAQQELNAAQAAYDSAAAAASRSGNLVSVWRGSGLGIEGSDKYLLDLRYSERGRSTLGGDNTAPSGFVAAVKLDGTVSPSLVATDNLPYFITDSDGDGLPNWREAAMGLNPRNGGDATTDSDGDGLSDAYEILAGTSPWNSMTDAATLDAQREATFTFDSKSYVYQYDALQKQGVSPLSTADSDIDDDGLSDWQEVIEGEVADNALLPYKQRSLKFDSNAIALPLPNTPHYALEGSFSLDLWLKLSELPGSAGATLLRRTVTSQGETTVNFDLGLSGASSPYIKFESNGLKATVQASEKLVTKKWYHLAAVFNQLDNSLSLYLDNQRVASNNYSGLQISFKQIGKVEQQLGGGFVGYIDSLRIWNAAKANFADRYDSANHAVMGTVPGGLVASFIFDDGGKSAQNYALPAKDWLNAWSNAIELASGAEMLEDVSSPVFSDTDEDSDGDGIPDWWEMRYFGDLTTADRYSDYDGDGLPDYYEYLLGLDPTKPKSIPGHPDVLDGDFDSDGDGLINRDEAQYGCDPRKRDTDDDGVEDFIEVQCGSSPIHPDSIAVDSDGNKITLKFGVNITAEQLRERVESGEYRNGFAPAMSLSVNDLPLDTPDGASGQLPYPDRFAVGKGVFTLEMWVKNSDPDAVALTGEHWHFEAQGDTFMGYRLGLQDGAPVGQIYRRLYDAASSSYEEEVIVTVGGSGSTPQLEADTWTHLALVWDTERRSLVLYRDRLSVLGSHVINYPIDFGESAFKAELGAVPGGSIDEFRFWASSHKDSQMDYATNPPARNLRANVAVRSDELIDYWSGRIIPTPIEHGSFYHLTAQNDMLREPYSLQAYYRFDDGGAKVEDFAHFGDEKYMLTLADPAYVFSVGAKELEGFDDVDGDGLPEWWVQYYELNNYRKYNERRYASEVWNSSNVFQGISSTHRSIGYLPLDDNWIYNRPADSEGDFIINNLVLTTVGDPNGNRQYTDNVSTAYTHIAMLKYIYLSSRPVSAMLNIRNFSVNVAEVKINGQELSGSLSAGSLQSVDIAPYLKLGRNQIFIGYDRGKNPGVNNAFLQVGDTLYQGMYRIGAGYIDVELKADGNPLVVFGRDYPYDPRSMWRYGAATDYSFVSYSSTLGSDLLGLIVPNADYAQRVDFDRDGLDANLEFRLNYNPRYADSNNNGIVDGDEDYDGDGLTNKTEFEYGTDPLVTDTDNDGIPDNAERSEGTDPLDFNDPLTHRELVLDGTPGSYLQLPDSARFKLSTWTIEAWVNPGDLANDAIIIERVVGTVNLAKPLLNYSLRLVDGGKLQMLFTDKDGNEEELSASNPVNIGEWTHVAMSYDGSSTTMALYVNGENVSTQFATRLPVSSGPGLVSTRVGEGFEGALDDIRIWSSLRGATDINSYKAMVLAGTEAGLVAYYRFDDVSAEREDGPYKKKAADSQKAYASDWLSGWANAATLMGNAEVVDSADTPFESDADENHNGIPDRWELKYFGRLLDEGSGIYGKHGDYDGDGLTNYYEYLAGTNPLISSTFGDKPDSEYDSDGDGLSNIEEQQLGLHPGQWDSDDDGYPDGRDSMHGKSGELALADGSSAFSQLPRQANGALELAAGDRLVYNSYRYDREAERYIDPLALTGNFSLELWFKLDSLADCTILRKRSSIAGSTHYEILLRNQTPLFKIGANELQAAEEIESGKWYHLAAVRNGALLTLTLADNDNLLAATTATGSFVGSMPQSLGTELILGGSSFAGQVDELRVWNTARSLEELSLHRNADWTAGRGVNMPAELVLYSTFNDRGNSAENYAAPRVQLTASSALTLPDHSLAGKLLDGAVFVDCHREIPLVDSNHNGIDDAWEYTYFNQLLSDDTTATGKYGDFDDDGLNNYYEYLAGTNPLQRENHALLDSDGDGLSNLVEQQLGLHPGLADSDDDGRSDAQELNHSSPYLSSSLDEYRMDQALEFASGSDALLRYAGTWTDAEGNEKSLSALTASFSIEFWLLTTEDDQNAALVTRAYAPDALPQFKLELESGKLVFAVGANRLSSRQAWPSGTWVHVAAVFNAASGQASLRLATKEGLS
ncbi:MAG: LamG-like jellyroll fold domain-containing protein, partial [Lentisphaeria bacterium]